MNASWSMVLGALLAGTVGGFMIPVRPEIRDVPAISASKTTEPARKSASDKNSTPATTENAEVRQIPVTESAAKTSEPAAQADATSCERQTWPNQSPNCLDRSTRVAPAATVVPARRIDPAVGVQDKSASSTETKSVAAPAPATAAPSAETKSVATPAPATAAPSAETKTVATPAPPTAAPKQETVAAPKPEPAKPKPKVASTPPAREDRAERPAQPEAQPAREAREQSTERPARTEQASTPPTEEPRAHTTAERNSQAAERPRRSTRRVNRNAPDFNDDIPTRIYLRGPDGRLYLAPEYRPAGREVYIMR
jgi:hypothetical protein